MQLQGKRQTSLRTGMISRSVSPLTEPTITWTLLEVHHRSHVEDGLLFERRAATVSLLQFGLLSTAQTRILHVGYIDQREVRVRSSSAD